MSIAFPKPNEAVLARRDEILTGLARLVAPEALVVSEDERRAFETDALTAYRKMPLAVVLPSRPARRARGLGRLGGRTPRFRDRRAHRLPQDAARRRAAVTP